MTGRGAGGLRFDKGHWWLPEEELLGFISVPAGRFLMGSDHLTEDEKPLHHVELPQFWIARYPTTVAQFREFTLESSYHDFALEALRSPDDHPVVLTSWSDALRYCEWLSSKVVGLAIERGRADALWRGLADGNLSVNLPSEAEWEKAARGTDGRTFPWGGEFDPGRVNIDETGIGGTSAVGSFPLGASPYGALDMIGNVWEWTRSIYGAWNPATEEVLQKTGYPYVANDGRETPDESEDILRVIRGGSFAHDRADTPCAYRGYDAPDCRCGYVGFRVAISGY